MVSVIRLDADEHPIKSVTVSRSNRAEIVRVFKVSLEVSRCHVYFSYTKAYDELILGRPE